MTRALVLIMFAAAAGCAQDLRPAQPDAAGPGDPDAPPPPGKLATTPNGDGSFTTVVDSTSSTEWVRGDFTSGALVDDDGGPWHLRFQRFHIALNGGVSGSAGVEVAPVAAATLAQVTAAPATGWITDEPDGDDPNTDPDYAFEQGDGWYAYDASTHVLTPRPIVWVVKLSAGAFVKLRIEKYYDAAGTSGWFTLTWAPL